MASTLAQQLQRIADVSVNTVSAERLKATYSVSLLYPPQVAATQDIDLIYSSTIDGFAELVELDPRFKRFERGIFSDASRSIDRFTQTKEENDSLNRNVEEFLGLVGPRVLLRSAQKAVEWLVRKFRIHELNTAALILTFLPYHGHPVFAKVLSIIPKRSLPIALSCLAPHIKPASCPSRDNIIKSLTAHSDFFNILTLYVLEVVARSHAHHVLVSFYITVVVEALNRMCSTATYSKHPEDIITKVMPILVQGLKAKNVPEFQIGCYMIITVLVAKLPIDDKLLDSLIAEVIEGWSKESISAALACVALMAQERRSRSALPKQAIKGLAAVDNLGQKLVDMSKKYRVDELAAGLSIGILSSPSKHGLEGIKLVQKVLTDVSMPVGRRRDVLTKLLQAAIKGDITEENVRIEVADFLVGLGEATNGTEQLGGLLKDLLTSEGVDVETLELRLQTVIRPAVEPTEETTQDKSIKDATKRAEQVTFASLLSSLPKTTADISFLSPNPVSIYTTLTHALIHATSSKSNQQMIDLFSHPIFTQKAANEAFNLSFLVKVWTSKTVPALARAAALAQAQKTINTPIKGLRVDFQALIPYILIALGDLNKKVRAEAGNLLLSLMSSFKTIDANRKDKSSKTKIWGFDTIFDFNTEAAKWMETAEARKIIEGLGILEALEEAMLDRDVVRRVLAHGLGRVNDNLKNSLKATAVAFISSHIIGLSSLAIKLELLKLVNAVTTGSGVKAMPTAELLQSWVEPADYAVKWGTLCTEEKVDIAELEKEFAKTVTSSDKGEGVAFLIRIIKGEFGSSPQEIGEMRSAACGRLREVWSSLKKEVKASASQDILVVATSHVDETAIPGEAMEILKSVAIPMEVFEGWLQDCLNSLRSWTVKLGRGSSSSNDTEPSKKKKTGVEASETPTGDEDVVGSKIDDLTAILELLEVQPIGEGHVDLLKLGFGILSEVMNVAGEIGVSVGYLLQLILGVLGGVVGYIKTSKDPKRKLDGSVRADVLVNCIRSTTSPQVQNRALLLVASLADVAPEVVLHSVMPIFTFMGANVLRQDDEYSAHVIEQTVQRVIPPLVKSLHQQSIASSKSGVVGGVAELVSSFVTAYQHIPAHRRLRLFVKLTDTLGGDEFLFVVLSMLVEKYSQQKQSSRADGKEDGITTFCKDVAVTFGEETQLVSAVKYLDVVIDVLHNTPQGISQSIFSTIKDASTETRQSTAIRLLQMLSSILDNEKLRTQIGRRLNQGDADAERIRSHFSSALEKILALGKEYTEGSLRQAISGVMVKLLDLLSTPEFVKVVDTLITNSEFKRSALATFKDRVTSEFRADSASRTAILNLTPKIAQIVASPESAIEFKGDALSCLSAVTVKHGKRDPSIIYSLAEAVIGSGGLRSEDEGLRVLALICLTDMTNCLGGRIVPVVPKVVPFTLDLLEVVAGKKTSSLVHNAIFALLEGLVNTIPSFMTSYLQKILKGAWASTVTAGSDDSDSDSDVESVVDGQEITQELRTGLLDTIAKKMDVKTVMTAISATWNDALRMGYSATQEHLTTVSSLLSTATKGQVQKIHPLLTSFYLSAFALRKEVADHNERIRIDEDELDVIENACIDTTLKMVLKLNDTIFKPMFLQFADWAAEDLNESDDFTGERLQRTITFYNFTNRLNENLKSLVTEYYSYILPTTITLLNTIITPTTSSVPADSSIKAYTSLLRSLATTFSTDDREFWTSPMNFAQISTPVLSQLAVASKHTTLPPLIINAIVELACTCTGSDEQLKTIHGMVLKSMRSEVAEVRMTAVKTEMEFYRRLGEEWLGMLPETVPYIAELLEDDEEDIERETQRLIKLVEEYLGEGELEAMLT
ncbi:hypothetical protein DFH27DRAFT_509326 [Peziza echinospora]|nr:hypothetical protein DFH27DRAFT_509326 [Peziza echinospora]